MEEMLDDHKDMVAQNEAEQEMFGEILDADELMAELDGLAALEDNAGPSAADQVAAAMAMDSVPNAPSGKIEVP